MSHRIVSLLVGALFALALFQNTQSQVIAQNNVESVLLQIERGPRPAVYVDADGEGCCDFSAELEGTFQLNFLANSGEAWIDDVDVKLTSASTIVLGVPIVDPLHPYFNYGNVWLGNRRIVDAIPGILGESLGYPSGANRFIFGPEFTADSSYRWEYQIDLSGRSGLLTGKSLFWGDDGASFDVYAVLSIAVPEPSFHALAVSCAVLLLVKRHRGLGLV